MTDILTKLTPAVHSAQLRLSSFIADNRPAIQHLISDDNNNTKNNNTINNINSNNNNNDNSNNDNHASHYTFQHILLGVCHTSPVLPGWLIMSIAISDRLQQSVALTGTVLTHIVTA